MLPNTRVTRKVDLQCVGAVGAKSPRCDIVPATEAWQIRSSKSIEGFKLWLCAQESLMRCPSLARTAWTSRWQVLLACSTTANDILASTMLVKTLCLSQQRPASAPAQHPISIARAIGRATNEAAASTAPKFSKTLVEGCAWMSPSALQAPLYRR